MNTYGYGSVSYAADTMVSVHMGTQWGLIDRIFMTMLCIVAIWSCITALVMYLKRRRPGTASRATVEAGPLPAPRAKAPR